MPPLTPAEQAAAEESYRKLMKVLKVIFKYCNPWWWQWCFFKAIWNAIREIPKVHAQEQARRQQAIAQRERDKQTYFAHTPTEQQLLDHQSYAAHQAGGMACQCDTCANYRYYHM